MRENLLKEAGMSYSLVAVLPLLLSFLVFFVAAGVAGEGYDQTDWYKYLLYLLPQTSFAVAALIYFRRTKQPLKTTYCGCKPRYFALAVLLQFGLLFFLSEVNGYFIRFLELFGYTRAESTLPDLGGWNLLPAILVIALLPAIFEETIFRGILVRNMHAAGWGTAATALISGAMFSLFHGNPEQTVYQFLCGICFSLIALRSGSVLPTMLSHFLNNAVILALTSFGYETVWTMPTGVYIALIAVSGVCFVAALVYLLWFDRSNRRTGGVKGGKYFFFAAAIGLIVCAAEWIVTLIGGFFVG